MRWNTVSCSASSAISGIDWMPDEPVPMTATRWPVKSTLSWGQRPVKYTSPREVVGALDLGLLGHRQAAGRHDVVAARDRVAAVGGDAPARRRRRPTSPPSPSSRIGCPGAGRSARRRTAGSGGSRAGWRTSPTTSTRPRARGRRSTCSRRWRCRSGRPGSGSSTTCRRRRRPPPAPPPTGPTARSRWSMYSAGQAGAHDDDVDLRPAAASRPVPVVCCHPDDPLVRPAARSCHTATLTAPTARRSRIPRAG